MTPSTPARSPEAGARSPAHRRTAACTETSPTRRARLRTPTRSAPRSPTPGRNWAPAMRAASIGVPPRRALSPGARLHARLVLHDRTCAGVRRRRPGCGTWAWFPRSYPLDSSPDLNRMNTGSEERGGQPGVQHMPARVRSLWLRQTGDGDTMTCPETVTRAGGARWAAGLAAALTVAACGGTAPTGRPASAAPAAPAVSTSRATRPPSPAPVPPPKPKVVMSRFRAADRSVVILGLFQGPVRYRLHSGSTDPGSAALSVVHAGPRIGGGERRLLLAAFNGGFLLSAGAGGYVQEGHVIKPLQRGLASLVIDQSGT